MTTSAVIHALLFAWVVLQPPVSADKVPITEITYLEPGDLEAAAPAPHAAPAQEARSGAASRSTKEVRFQRQELQGDVTLEPMSRDATADRLEARLSAMQQTAVLAPAGTGTTVIPASLFGSGTAPMGGVGGGPAVSLNRGGPGGTPLPLTRGGSGGAGIAPSTLPATKGGGGSGAPAAADMGARAARRTVAGASLAGPIADRKVLGSVVPIYPDWAKREAVEGSVTLYFVVLPDGTVKENIVVQKTAGFGDFDENARAALRGWKFEPLRGGRTGEQWGTITFRFRLRDVG